MSDGTPGGTGKGAQRRAELLDAAEHILSESGHGELTMRAVATAAGVRLGHLQYYFPGRADLVAAVLERTLQRSRERLTPVFASVAQPDSAEELVRTLLAEQDDPQLVRVYTELWALAGHDDAVAAVLRKFYGTYRSHVADVVRAGNPDLPEAVRDARAAVFTILIEGAALFRSGIAGERTAATDDALVATAVALLRG
ncbi:TetR/AcrR family transcriptional regulator [Nocardia sp. NPDC051756]|uniref:TetR/AcrR family transcriptional regulator n=1 Tax=Nocardia sp. NPDC051756 TaxID=3154751 RepID=UPI00341D8FBF